MRDNIINLILERIARNYEEQLPYYEEMYRIALVQEKILEQAEIDADLLLSLISQRQELIDTLEERNRTIAPIKDEVCQALEINEFNLTNLQKRVNGPGGELLTNVLGQLAFVLGRIKEVDNKSEKLLREGIAKAKDKLGQVQNAKKATKAYQPAAALSDGVFIDCNK